MIRLVPARTVYGGSTGRLGLENEYIYQCQNCNARVGCHRGTTRPLGDASCFQRPVAFENKGIAAPISRPLGTKSPLSVFFDTAKPRQKMIQFYSTVRGGSLRRISPHIGGFEMDECARVIDLCNEKMEAA